MAAQVQGVHLVGSVPLPLAKDVFVQATKGLPNRLLRIPDGEPGDRANFIGCQVPCFLAIPKVLRQRDATGNVTTSAPPTEDELSALKNQLAKTPLQTRYDDHALESYATFTSLREDGTIPATVKFQVSLPTTSNALMLVDPGYQPTVAPFYRDALLRAVKRLESSIPHHDLCIQWDMSAEFAMLEGVTQAFYHVQTDGPVKQSILDASIKLVNSVPSDIECGLHLCYGDFRHEHFVQPKDMQKLVDIANGVAEGAERPVNWIHMPVPADRDDEQYFAALKDLRVGDAAIFLGLVHANDLEGTKRRIEAASTACKKFGVATECGLGRTPSEHLDSIFEICTTVTSPYH